MNPDRILATIDRFATAQIIGDLAGGPTSDSYLLQCDTERFVLRIDNHVAAVLGLDRTAEAGILAYVSRNRLGPEPEFAAPERGILITRYIEGRVWSETDLHDPQRIRRLVTVICRLHALEPVGRPLNLHDKIANYARISGTAEACELARETQRQLRELETGFTTRCLCHNNLICANIIEVSGGLADQGPALIDWEYAAVGDPFFDLAVIAEHHQFDREEARSLLRAYSGGIREADCRRLDAYRAVYANLGRLWITAVEHAGRQPLHRGMPGQ